MFVFMIALLPISAAFVWIKARDKALRLVIIAGFLTGILATTARAAFSFIHRVAPYSFIQNFLYYSAHEYALPAAALFAVYFFIVKDKTEFKIKSFFPLSAAFYSIYMPYCIIAPAGAFYFFTLFVKPALVLAMLIFYSQSVFAVYKNAGEKSKSKTRRAFVLLGLAAAAPSCIETLWLLNAFPFAVYLASALYILSAAFVIFTQRQKNSFLS
ncbi:MAG: hypothetical protein ACTTKL_08815 [Treponema sp.]